MTKAYFAPYGVGLGHASRLLSISKHLKNRCDVTMRFSSYGEAVWYIVTKDTSVSKCRP